MKKLFTLFSVIMMLAVTGTLLAQSVTLKMKRPPLNQLKAADLWSATITNSGEPFTAYLYGSMTNNENSELIATGQTMTFEVRTGTTNFKVSDLPRVPDINYLSKDPKYKQSFMNTGGAPPGDYKICVELRKTDNSVAGEDCFDQKIMGGDAPQLISPRNEEELNNDNPIFTWMHMKAGSDQTYTLRIVELKGKASPENAMLKNKAFFEKEGISQKMFQYPSSAPKYDKDKSYAWQVSTNGIKSEVHIFRYAPASGNSIFMTCTPRADDPCMYEISVIMANPVPLNAVYGWSQFRITSTNPITQVLNNHAILLQPGSSPTTTNPASSITVKYYNAGGGGAPWATFFVQGNHEDTWLRFQNSGATQLTVEWSSNAGNTFEGNDIINVNVDALCGSNVSTNDSCLLCNSDFEDTPFITLGYFRQIPQDSIPCWRTTGTSQKIEIWSDGFQGVPAIHGSQFAELNCSEVGTFYQTFTVTTPGTMNVYFAHRGRYAGQDIMNVNIGPVGGTYTTFGPYSDNNSAWSYYSVAYNFSTSGLYEIQFQSVSSDNGNGPPSGGNFLDAISVECKLDSIPVTPHETGSVCDTFKAVPVSAVSPTGGDCCWSLNLTHPANTSNINSIQFLALSPNSFVGGNSHLNSPYNSSPWMWTYINNGSEFTVRRLGSGSIPPGQVNSFVSFCLNKVSSPQHVVVNWRRDSVIVCSDTVTLNCDIPCVTFTNDTVVCNENNYNLNYSFTNNTTYEINKIEVAGVTPSGVTVTPTPFILSTPVNSGATTNLPAFTITGAVPGSTVCINFKFISTDGCCWCYDSLCVVIPSCVCNEVHATIDPGIGDPINCCYSLNLQNNFSGSYFNQVTIRTLEPGVIFSTWSTNTANDFYSTNTFSYSEIYLIHDQSNFPNSFIPLGNSSGVVNFCLDGYTSSTQHIVVEWMRNDSVKCVDTIETHCPPPPEEEPCSQIINDTLTCLPDGMFLYTFHIKNNSTYDATGFEFNAVPAGGFTFTPDRIYFSPSLPAGMTSSQQSMIISGVTGSQFCSSTSLFQHIIVNGEPLYGWCCHTDTVCVTTPLCDSCSCNQWKKGPIIAEGNGIVRNIRCDSIYNINPTSGVTISYPQYMCTPSSCNATYNWNITGPIPQSGTTNVISNANFSLPGSYVISMVPMCGTHICDTCKINVIVRGDSLCGCGEKWRPGGVISYNPTLTNVVRKKIDCFAKIIHGPITAGSNINFNANAYNCNRPGCFPSYNWKILETGTNNVINSGTSPTLPVNFPAPSAGNYQFVVYSVCDGKVCDSCAFYFKTDGNSDCECNDPMWQSREIQVSVNNVAKRPTACREIVTIDLNSNLSLTFPTYICNPKDCNATYTWDLKGGSGFSPVHVTGTSNPFNYTFNIPGLYTLWMKAYCGGKACDSCMVTINVKPISNTNCNCGSWKDSTGIPFSFGMISGNIKCGKSLSVMPGIAYYFTAPTYICNPNIGNCLPQYIWFVNGVQQATGGTFTYSFGNANTVVALKVKCGDKICDSCKFETHTNTGTGTVCDSTLNTVYHSSNAFLATVEGHTIDFATNYNGTPITDPISQSSFANWQWNDVTFDNISSYWNGSLYVGGNQNPGVAANFPTCTYTRVGFMLQQFWSVPGTYIIKIYTCDLNCTYTYTYDFNGKSFKYFGYHVPGFINRVEVSSTTVGFLMHDFTYGN